MNKNEIVKKASSALGKVNIKLRKHSPELLIAAGVVGTVVSTVLACKATTKLSTILDESKGNIETIHKCENDKEMEERYSQEDAKKDLAIVYIQTGVKIAKLYAPAVVLGTISIAGIVASNNILRKRNVALAAAYATVDKSFKEYRSRVVERFGADVDKELRYNIKAKKIEEMIKDPESGKEKKSKTTVNVAAPTVDDYARFFDKTCRHYEENMNYNLMLLRSQQQLANDKLVADGFLFLSDVYDMLGITRTKMSQSVGWIYKPDGNSNGDNFVDFGVMVVKRETEDGGYEDAILMNFNVDGPILDLI
ncbi:DUF6353 family protein [Blautia glucerasea]|jgi:hypothetical protein|uniref:DUF6353 family protein n=1 Tax=Blautia glucerasea TaxID=536633 RepID=UPI001D01017B|nr:DUF6353 family protein [Blautia glucerasea]MCB5386064.1 DUF6353 family protein [Blautia glucerasea]MCB5420413.1 DUF6353 family protein [Blautia luti]